MKVREAGQSFSASRRIIGSGSVNRTTCSKELVPMNPESRLPGRSKTLDDAYL